MLLIEKQPITSETMDQLAADVNRDGICVIRQLIDKNVIAEWHDALAELREKRAREEGGLAARENARFYLTLPWCQPFAAQDVFAHPVILGVIERVLKQAFQMVQLGADFPVLGSDYQETHRDHAPLFGEGINTPLYALAVNLPLVDINDHNGPFEMARGTHLIHRDEGLRKIESGEIKLERFFMERGDVIIRTPLALHRGTPNLTETWRPMVVMGYVNKWLRTDNVTLRIPRSYYETLTPELQALLRCELIDCASDLPPETYLSFKY
jgi:ectoine hydroxylase-related dioxygenase (phytanoyl-CoA dioxygenase family)